MEYGFYLRKIIHLLSVLIIPLHFFVSHYMILWIGITALFVYALSESLRLRGKKLPLITDITVFCAYPKELKGFIATPVIFGLSLLILLLFFPIIPFYLGVISASLGDTSASLIGKKFGKTKIRRTGTKSWEGFIACFVAVFASSVFLIGIRAVLIAFLAAFIESVSKDFDNVTLPLGIAFVSMFVV